MEAKIKHLEMIQGIISRMANCSFVLKGWAVTIVVALFALAGKDANRTYFLIAYMPIAVFWLLDSYYLYQERLYRALYDNVRKRTLDNINFGMSTDVAEAQTRYHCYCSCVFSKTEFWFYVPIAVVCLILILA